MKIKLLLAALWLGVGNIVAAPVGSSFTYQGRLMVGSSGANGRYDLQFALYDAVTNGAQIGGALNQSAIAVSDGLFTVNLDFGAGAFNGAARWLELSVRTNGGAGFNVLSPRQPVTAAPYSLTAGSLTGLLPVNQLTGTVALAQLPVMLVTNNAGGVTLTGSFSGNGAGLTNLTPAQLAIGSISGDKIAPGTLRMSQIDDGGSMAYADFTATAATLGRAEPLPFAALSLVTTNSAAPSLSFTLAGASFGTVVGLVGQEAMSAPTEFTVTVLNSNASFDPATQMGRRGRVTFNRNGRATSFAGIVTGCSLGSNDGTNALYIFRLESPLAILALTTDYRVTQDITVPDLAVELYQDITTNAVSVALTRSYETRETVVQFAESDLSFFSRLLEDEGIAYYFRQDTVPLIVLDDDSRDNPTAPNSPFPYFGNVATNIPIGAEFVRSFQKSTRETPRQVTLREYLFNQSLQLPTESAVAAEGRGELYQFGSSAATSAALEAQAELRMDRVQVERATMTGTANAPDLRPGYVFTLTDQSGAGVGGSYLVTAVRHSVFRRTNNGVASYFYGNQFEVIPAATPFRPAVKTPRPVAQACTAVVVGDVGNAQAYTDQHGRVKVQFHWDRYGAMDPNSSGWVRVANPMAGPSHSVLFLPRPGDEVLVEFIQGDPDQPVITGSLHNSGNMPPVALPGSRNVSVIRTTSTNGAVNEIRFNDTPASEQLAVSAGRNLDVSVAHDQTVSVGNDFVLAVGKNLAISAASNIVFSAASIGIGTSGDPLLGLNVGGGGIRATAYQGNGAGLTNLSAAALAGTINDARLSANIPRLNGGQTFTAANAFSGPVTFSNAVQSFGSGGLRLNDTDIYFRLGTDWLHGLGWYGSPKLFGGVNINGPVLYGNGGGALGAISGSTNIALRWDSSQSVTVYGTLFMGANIRLSDRDLLLRSDLNHGLGWYGAGKLFGGASLDGPILYGYSGGGLGTLQNGIATNLAVAWNAAGNVGIGTNSPAQKLVVAGNIYATGTITPNSDRNLKTGFQPVNSAAVLAQVARLPIQQWRFQAEPEGVKHIGPMAQDFRAAFGLGEIPTAISTVDADGVALAAIQGLNQKVESLQAENAELRRELDELKKLIHDVARPLRP